MLNFCLIKTCSFSVERVNFEFRLDSGDCMHACKGRHQWKKSVFFRALTESNNPPPRPSRCPYFLMLKLHCPRNKQRSRRRSLLWYQIIWIALHQLTPQWKRKDRRSWSSHRVFCKTHFFLCVHLLVQNSLQKKKWTQFSLRSRSIF